MLSDAEWREVYDRLCAAQNCINRALVAVMEEDEGALRQELDELSGAAARVKIAAPETKKWSPLQEEDATGSPRSADTRSDP